MKKKLIALLTVLTMVASLTACGSSMPDVYNYDLSEYVKLGDYLGVEIEKIEPNEVTEEDLESELQNRLEENTKTEECKEGVVEDGMSVNIDYEGKIDGATFDGGSAQGYDLIIGSGSFIDGFETGLIGKNIGDTVTLDLTFPDPYENNPDLAGKPVQFTVKINSYSKEIVPELNEEFVKSVSECKTVDDYKALVKKELEEQAAESAKQQMQSAVWSKVLGNAEVLKYPETEVADKEKQMKDYYQQYADSNNMTMEDFLEMAGMTQEDFDKEAKNSAESSVKEEMVMYSIARAEGIKVSNSEYKKGAQKYVEDFGFEDIAALEKQYTKETIQSSLLWEEMFDFLLDKAKIVEPKAEEETQEETAAPADAAKTEGEQTTEAGAETNNAAATSGDGATASDDANQTEGESASEDNTPVVINPYAEDDGSSEADGSAE